MGGNIVKENGSVNSFARSQNIDFALSAGLGLGLLILVNKGLCACTAFTGVSLLMVALSTVMVGNRAFASLTMEREKKTLDCLRLTQWSAQQVLGYKLLPEMLLLLRILIVLGPSVLILGGLSDAGLARALGVLLVSCLGGLAAGVFGIFISSLSDTTSHAYVAGRCGKAVWLLLTPILDKLLAAVVVSTKTWPVFTSLNPWAATWGMALPESAVGADALLPFFSLVALPVATLAMWIVACRRFDSGMVASPSLTDRRVHPLYTNSHSWPRFLRGNPALLRELALQLRSGAGRWPGYMVFFVLFLAPFLYAQSWTFKAQLNDEQENTQRRVVQVDNDVRPQGRAHQNPSSHGISLRSSQNYNVRYVLKGHTPGTCLRMLAYQWWLVPLPAHELVKVVEPRPEYTLRSDQPLPPSQFGKEQALTGQEAAQIGAAGMTAHSGENHTYTNSNRPLSISRAALAMGLTGGITLLLIYLGIRCSGFLAAAVTGEKERCTWNDLILSGLSPVSLLVGKVGGSLLMPMTQMTIAFPSLLLFVAAGTIGIPGILGLYLYTLGLAAVFALLGLWCSATSRTSHESHTKALVGVLLVFGLGTLSSKLPLTGPFLTGLMVMLVLSSGRGFNGRAKLAGLLAVVLSFVCPAVISPLSACQGFLELPTLERNLSVVRQAPHGLGFAGWVMGICFLYCWAVMLWETTLRRLGHRNDNLVMDCAQAA